MEKVDLDFQAWAGFLLNLATAFWCVVLCWTDACVPFLLPFCLMCRWCWTDGRLLFETNLVYLVSGLGLLVQVGALFTKKDLGASRVESSRMQKRNK